LWPPALISSRRIPSARGILRTINHALERLRHLVQRFRKEKKPTEQERFAQTHPEGVFNP
jgi:hypothetical protein